MKNEIEREPEKKIPTLKSNRDLLYYLLIRIRETRKWWLLPLLLLLAVLSMFISFTGNQSILPAIYVIF